LLLLLRFLRGDRFSTALILLLVALLASGSGLLGRVDNLLYDLDSACTAARRRRTSSSSPSTRTACPSSAAGRGRAACMPPWSTA